MCFTALVRLIDGQMPRRVLCFFLLPGCSGVWQTSQLQARSLHLQWMRLSNQMTPYPPGCRFQMPNLMSSLKIGFVWFCHGNGSTGKQQSTTLGFIYSFWQAKALKLLNLKQLRTWYKYTVRKYSIHIPSFWDSQLPGKLKLGYTWLDFDQSHCHVGIHENG